MISFFDQFRGPASPLLAVKVNSSETRAVVRQIVESRGDPVSVHPVERWNAVRTLRDELADDIVAGKSCCPVCNSPVDIYQRPMYASMIKLLKRMYALGGLSRPVTIKELGANGGDHGKLRFWGLVIKVYSHKDGSGLGWKVTRAGHEFLLGNLSVPKKVVLFENQLIGYSMDEICIDNNKIDSTFKISHIKANLKDHFYLLSTSYSLSTE